MKLVITEGISGTWFYHLSEDVYPVPTKSLCGAWVMGTRIPLGRWNRPIKDYHLPERFCSKCEEIRATNG